jgi:chromosome partitioning protein
MLDLAYSAGEYEALARCLLEETIMRGRRRGRNRPSPPSSSPAGSTDASASGSSGTVTVLDTSDQSGGTTTPAGGTTLADTEATSSPAPAEDDSNAGADLASAEADSPGNRPTASLTQPDTEGQDGVPALEEPADAPPRGAPSDSSSDAELKDASEDAAVPETAARPDQPVSSPAPGSVKASSPAPDSEEPAPAQTGRQPQAASGNPLPRVLAVANQKGGVGKTTTSVNLGAALAELGFRVLVIDLDPQGNATTGLGIDARNFELSMYDVLMRDSSLEDCVEPTSMKNLFVAPATIALAGAEIELVPAFSRELKLKRAIESVIDDFDYVLIDCPPSLGLITVNALAAADEVLVPIQCEYYALEGLSQLMRNVHLVASNLNPRLDISTIVLTMYDARTKLADQVASEVREHFGNKVCRIVIPRTVRLSEAPSFGQPITAFDPASRGAIAYRELAKEVSGGTS